MLQLCELMGEIAFWSCPKTACSWSCLVSVFVMGITSRCRKLTRLTRGQDHGFHSTDEGPAFGALEHFGTVNPEGNSWCFANSPSISGLTTLDCSIALVGWFLGNWCGCWAQDQSLQADTITMNDACSERGAASTQRGTVVLDKKMRHNESEEVSVNVPWSFEHFCQVPSSPTKIPVVQHLEFEPTLPSIEGRGCSISTYINYSVKVLPIAWASWNQYESVWNWGMDNHIMTILQYGNPKSKCVFFLDNHD